MSLFKKERSIEMSNDYKRIDFLEIKKEKSIDYYIKSEFETKLTFFYVFLYFALRLQTKILHTPFFKSQKERSE